MKRLSIYFFYDKDGIVRRFVTTYLEGLKDISDKVVVVVNGDLSDESYERINNIVDYVYVRENKGFDVWAYKVAMENIGWEKIREYDELVLCNFTCYGPMYPFDEMFKEMENRDCDFWGVAKHPEQSNYLLDNRQGYIYEHIMSYFIVIKSRLLKSECFKTYWDSIPDIKTKTESTAYHETVFTKHFEDMGYKSDSFVDLSLYENKCNNNSILMANELLIKSRCPLVKRRAFFFPEYETIVTNSLPNRARELIDYIDIKTDYDIDLIWEDILETQKISDFYYNLSLSYTPRKGDYNLKNTGIFIYIPQEQYFDVFWEKIRSVAKNIDIFVLFEDECIKDYIVKKTSRELNLNIFFRQLFLIGDDVTQYAWIEVSKEMCKYDYVVVAFEYSVCFEKLQLAELDYIEYLYSCIFDPIVYKSDIYKYLHDNKRLGALFPSAPLHGQYYGKLHTFNLFDETKNKEIFKKMDLQIPFDEHNPFNNVCVFWAKKACIEKVSSLIMNNSLYSIGYGRCKMGFFLPMMIQNAGFFVSSMICERYINSNLINYEYLRYALLRNYFKKNKSGCFRLNGQINNVLMKDTEYVPYVTKEEALKLKYSFKELVGLLRKYPKSHKEYRKNKQKTGKPKEIKKNCYTYLRNVSIENNRLVLYFMCGMPMENNIRIPLNDRYIYPRVSKDVSRKEVEEYVKEYSNAYVGFYEIPINLVKNQTIMLVDKQDNIVNFKWASGISYNLFDLNDIDLYLRVLDGVLYVETKEVFEKNVLSCSEYSSKDKFIFRYMLKNKFNDSIIMSENLSAADNTFELFKYMLSQGKDVYYVVSADTYESMKNTKFAERLLIHNSKKHIKKTILASKWITSFSLRNELLPNTELIKDIHYNLMKAEWIFIPHGMALGDRVIGMLQKYSWDNPSRTFACNKIEEKAYIERYGFRNVKSFGSPRMDKWFDYNVDDNQIFFFFTWRLGLSVGRKKVCDDFTQSTYFKTICELISFVRTIKPNAIIHYAFHHEIVKAGYDEFIKSALLKYNINFIYFKTYDDSLRFNKSFGESKYLVTDFSSVAYDFSYKNDAIAIYYLNKDFIAHHYILEESFFDNHLGIVTTNHQELESALDMKKPTKEMLNRRERFFYSIDNNNCRRLSDEIFNTVSTSTTEQKIEDLNNNKKRLAIYFFYDEEGIIDDYIFYYLESLRQVCSEIAFVSNGKILDRYKEKLSGLVDYINERENVGFDSWAYKEVINYYGYEKLKRYDEVILNNFTNFGPMYSFKEMFEKMDSIDCDFWGHNRYYAMKNRNNRLDDVEMLDHLQSYFIVFRNSILSSDDFRLYWETLKLPLNYTEAVKYHEIRCTDFFEKKGYISSEFIPFSKYKNITTNGPVYMAYSQLTEDRSPLLKRKVYFVEKGKYSFPLREEHSVYDLNNYIIKETNYDISLIKDNIYRTQDLSGVADAYDKMEIEDYIKNADEHNETYYILKNTLFNKETFNNSFLGDR